MLVGGQGTRLRPLTLSAPKPMLPTAGVPFLTHQLARARDAGVDHVVLATSYRADTFEAHFGDGSALGLELEYVTEIEPLGTGGGIRNVAERLRGDADAPVLVFNGDVLSGHDIAAQVALHTKHDASVTLYLTQVEDARAFGCVPIDADGRVTAFLEKMPEPVTNLINAGCYVFRRDVIDEIPYGRAVSVERETFPQLLASGATVMGYVDSAYWLDLGTPAAFVQGSCDLVRGIAPSPALPGPTGEFLILEGATVAASAVVSGGSCVGADASIGDAAIVEGSVVFDRATIEPTAVVRRSVVGRGAIVGVGTVLEGVVVGDGAHIGAGNELLDGVRVWPHTEIAARSVRFSSDA
ncbi:MAG: mannose-phosphate guanylyltransferase [Actinomycetota bacterium]|nr:mannose-phosphate guanylyltransferase [Actinomycetota bacterium]